MRPRRTARVLLVVGLLLLPAPLYLGAGAELASPPPRTSQLYAAEPLDPANATDRATIADDYGTAVALSTHQVSEQYSAGEYRAPTAARRTLERAMASGSATVDNPDAQADLRAIARDNTFIYDAYSDDDDQYYRLRVTDNGSTVRASPVAVDRVANATVDAATVAYADLSADERRTVDRILANSSGSYSGYRPRVNDPFVDQLPTLVRKDGQVYGIFVNGWVDDFGPGFVGFLFGVFFALVGVAAILVAGAIYGYLRWRTPDDAASSEPATE